MASERIFARKIATRMLSMEELGKVSGGTFYGETTNPSYCMPAGLHDRDCPGHEDDCGMDG